MSPFIATSVLVYTDISDLALNLKRSPLLLLATRVIRPASTMALHRLVHLCFHMKPETKHGP